MNKILTAITALVVSAGLYTASDLGGLRDTLFGIAPETEEQDVNGDGSVDVFDLVAMRKELLGSGEFTESAVPVTDEYVNFIGRYSLKGETAWLVQSGSAVEFTVSGKSAEVTLAGDSCINSDEKYRPRYAVIVDGEIILDELMSEKTKTVELFSGEETRTATVKVIHLSEANNGAIGVSGIKVQSDSPVPVAPTPEKDLKIEFIGDSITCAYGVEGTSAYENFKTSTENFMKSYAYLTAEKLDAEYSAVSYSGHGIVSGYSSDGEKVSDQTVPPYYENVGKLPDYAEKWDFEANPNDVVVINLGTNDSSYTSGDAEKEAEYTELYTEFLKTVRKNNPDAYIICTLGTMGGTELCPCIDKAVADFKAETGDERVMSYQSVTQNPDDGLGSDWHPSAVTQQKSAYVLADKICQALGMKSDRIGLDVAVDAEYRLDMNKDSGANASEYISDYDKSFWINAVVGGSKPEDIKAVLDGISLDSGTYTLSFQCTAPDEKEIPVILRSADGSEIYYSDKFTGGGEKKPYESEITLDIEDEKAVLEFQVGGDDYCNVTLYNIKMQKIK